MAAVGFGFEGLGILASVAAIGVSAVAVQAAPQGCFERIYGDAHLSAQPAQVVRDISVAFGDFAGDEVPWMDVQVLTSDQGHVARAGQAGRLVAGLARCTPSDATLYGWSCSVECDGGTVHIERLDDRVLVMRTAYFVMGTGDECGGEVDLAEVPGHSVTYRLDRVPDVRCAGRWD